MSQTFIVTFPLVIFLILKPTVGIISWLNWPEAITFTKVVLPEHCSPTKVSSISSFQNKLLNQSNIRLIRDIILKVLFYGQPEETGITLL
uniref:Putative secreted protein n=1 Tax=Panstrongylus lignarius TaxID=156445 RepID=A0A224Y3H7_9HEMI